MSNEIQNLIKRKTGLNLGVNKLNEVKRLIYEIHRRENIKPEQIFHEQELKDILKNKTISYLNKFAKIKKYLIQRRFPNAVNHTDFNVYFSKIDINGSRRLKPADYNKKTKKYSGAFYPKAIYIEQSVKDSILAKRIKTIFPKIKVKNIESLKQYRKNNLKPKNFNNSKIASPLARNDTHKVIARSKATKQSSLIPQYDLRKRDIFITRQGWDFLKPCPCSTNVVCCNYHIINLGFGCPYDCSYCYLQHYTNSPGIVLEANIQDFLNKTDEYLKKFNKQTIRIGTGEFTDSLALDNITEYSKTLVPFFASKNALLELKTKSSNINNLIGLNHNEKTVVSWSLNPQSIIKKQELGTASLEQRLESAIKCRDSGYKIGFHFDPIIYYQGWEKDYEDVVNKLFDSVNDVEWISLGTLRFHRSLKNIIEYRFPETDYIYEEMIIGQDKKIRYYSALRKEIFEKMISWIRKRNNKTAVYLCMEPTQMWVDVLQSGTVFGYKVNYK